MKMKYFFLLLFLFPAIKSSAQKQFVVDPNAEVREISGSFTSIKVSSGLHVFLSQGDAEAIAISAPTEKYKEGIKTEIENGELNIYYSGYRLRYDNDQRMNVYVAYKNLEQIYASGASDVFLAGVMDVPVLNVHMSGASDMKGEIKVKELNIKLSGASDVRLSGKATSVNIESSGASDVKAYGLSAESCNVKVSGASDVNITVTGELSANASGASNVYYKGTGELKVKQSNGASSIEKRE
jgi:hypothetical protein